MIEHDKQSQEEIVEGNEPVQETEITTEEVVQVTEEQPEQETVSKADYDELLQKFEGLQSTVPVEPTDKEKEFAEREKALFTKEISLSLKENNLGEFEDIINVKDADELQNVISKLKKVVGDIKLESGYVPTEHAQQSSYEHAKQQGDAKGMIKNIFRLN